MDRLRYPSASLSWREYQRLLACKQPRTVLHYPEELFAVSERLEGVETDRRGYLVSPVP